MNIYFINVETSGKYKNVKKKNSHLTFFRSPVNDALLHKCRNKNKNGEKKIQLKKQYTRKIWT